MTRNILTSPHSTAKEKEDFVVKFAKHIKALPTKTQKDIKEYVQKSPVLKERFASIIL